MNVWSEPNVRKHVEDRTDYRLSNLFEKLIIKASSDKIGNYVYDTTGEDTTKIEIYDVSSTALMEKFYELRDKCDTYEMEYVNEYKAPTIANDQYENVTLGPLILLMNNKYTNADFVVDDSETYKMLSKEDVVNLLYKIDYDSSNTVEEIEDAEEYAKFLENGKEVKNKINATTDELSTAKLKRSFKDLENKPEYKRLVSEFGDTEVKRIIKLLTSYNKEG